MMICAIAILTAADVISGMTIMANSIVCVALLFPVALAIRIRDRRQILQLVRMENVNASRLWVTEMPPPPAPWPTRPMNSVPYPYPAPSPYPAPTSPTTTGGEPVIFRFSTRRLLGLYGTLAAMLALTQVIWLQPGQRLLAGLVTLLMGAALGLVVYRVVRRGRPWEPPVVLDTEGIVFPAQGVRVAWSEIHEIRISPVRGGNARTAQRRVVAFIVGDPQECVQRFHAFAQKQARRSVDAYGTPISVTDQLLERTAEDIVAAAARFTSAPVRRFG
jgi:hypothetical protein